MKWLEICVTTTDEGLDAVIFAFSNAGLDQVSIEESHERAMAFLNERRELLQTLEQLKQQGAIAGVDGNKPQLGTPPGESIADFLPGQAFHQADRGGP